MNAIQIFCGYSGLLNFVTCLSLAIFLFIKNPKGLINRLFAAWSTSVAFWSLGYFLWLFTERNENALFWTRILMAGAILIPTVYIHFALTFLGIENQKRYRVLLVIGYLFSFIYLSLDFTPLFIAKVEPRYWFRWWPVPGSAYHVYQIYFLAAVVYSHFLLFQRVWTEHDPIEKKRFLFVALGTLIAYAGGSTNFFLWYNIPIPPVFNLLVSGYVAFIAYAIVKYQVMDIEMALTRSAIFILLYTVIIGLPAAVVVWAKNSLMGQFGDFWWSLPLGIYTVLTIVGPFIYGFFQQRAEEALLKAQRAYQQTLLQASKGMTLIKDLDRLLKLIVHILTKTIRITHAHIFLWDNNIKQFICKASRGDCKGVEIDAVPEGDVLIEYLTKTKGPLISTDSRFVQHEYGFLFKEANTRLEKMKATVIIPSFVQDRLLGFVVLGSKKSQQGYTESDLDTLVTLANQAALAIENCIFLTEFEHQQAHFFQAAKMADLGTMASGIGHQVNNRFNVIKLGAESAMMMELGRLKKYFEKNDPENGKKLVEGLTDTCQRIAKNAEHGGEIVKRLLDFSRLAQGFKLMDVKEAIESSVRLWECKHDLREIGFQMEISSDLMKIKGNFSEVEEILFNLLDNAADAIKMKEEAFNLGNLSRPADYQKGAIWLKAENSEVNRKPHVLISVRENGIGMDEETQKRIFVPFFTMKATAIKGTGLGLYIIRRMVDAHQGRIKVDSEYGKGTTFYIYLPSADGG